MALAPFGAAPASLAALSLPELRAMWFELKGGPLPRHVRRKLAILAVAHALAERAEGGLDGPTQKVLEAAVRQITPSQPKRAVTTPKTVKPGTRLMREWRGEVHEVMVVAGGFVWREVQHRSLSAIARQITGTRWNGWTFFGLNKPAPQRAASRGVAARREPARAAKRSPAHG